MENTQNEDLLEALIRSTSRILSGVSQLLREYSLCTTEFAVLEAIHALGPQPIQKVAERVLVTSGSMTHTVDQMIAKGLIVRVRCTRDARRFYLHLTPEGSRVIEAALPKHNAYIAEIFAPLSAEEKTSVTQALAPLMR